MARSHRFLVVLFVGAALLWPAPNASAQVCFGPDNLDIPGACCVQVIPNLPPFPPMALDALGLCWNGCSLSQQQLLRVNWAPPAQFPCSEFTTTLTVTDSGSGLPIMSGPLVLDYTRTWDEITTTGVVQQVWRFVAKADLSPVPGGPSPCPVPACLPPPASQPSAFFYGYADYTCVNAANGFEAVLVLYHACDYFIHLPGLSSRPGVFHPGVSYAIVAPHSTVQPFLPIGGSPGGGALIGEAMRDMGPTTPPPFVCISEDRVQSGAMTPIAVACVCTLSSFPPQQTLRQFTGQTQCVNTAGLQGGWASVVVNFPALPWFHMVTTSIGRWSNPNVYPSTERAFVDEGLFAQQGACSGDFVELKYGGSTRAGWQVLLSLPGNLHKFTDLADNYTAPIAGPFPMPALGSIHPTDHLIYVNMP